MPKQQTKKTRPATESVLEKHYQSQLAEMRRILTTAYCGSPAFDQMPFGKSKDQGRIFLFVGISMAVIQGGFIRRFKGGREAETLVASILSQAVAYLVIGLAPSEIPFYIGMLFYSFTSAAFVPAFNGLTSLKVPSDQQGQAMGKLRSINALARAFGPSAVSILFWIFGPAVSFAIAAALTVSVAVSFRRLSYS
nr:unnamed protein product [Spirometra erinaceieuropaei]